MNKCQLEQNYHMELYVSPNLQYRGMGQNSEQSNEIPNATFLECERPYISMCSYQAC